MKWNRIKYEILQNKKFYNKNTSTFHILNIQFMVLTHLNEPLND